MHRLSKLQRSTLSAFLLGSASIWIFISIRAEFSRISNSLASLRPSYVGISVVLVMMEILIVAYVYYLLLSRSGVSRPFAWRAVMPFVASRVVSYLPGKIWGIVYQASAVDRSIPTWRMVSVNIEQYLLVTLNSIAVAAGVFTYYHKGLAAGLIIFSATLSLIYTALKGSLLQRTVSILTGGISVRNELFQYENRKGEKDLLILGLLQVDWLFYIIACALILPVYFGSEDIVMIATCYSVAWIVSSLSSVTPGGLIVREASFIWLAGLFGYDPVIMFAFSIAARILFTISDVIGAVLSLVLADKTKTG